MPYNEWAFCPSCDKIWVRKAEAAIATAFRFFRAGPGVGYVASGFIFIGKKWFGDSLNVVLQKCVKQPFIALHLKPGRIKVCLLSRSACADRFQRICRTYISGAGGARCKRWFCCCRSSVLWWPPQDKSRGNSRKIRSFCKRHLFFHLPGRQPFSCHVKAVFPSVTR